MTEIHETLRELVIAGPPGYQPPVDPYALVATRVQRRRRHRRVTVLSCAATVIAGGVLAVPLLADSLAGAGFVVAGSPPSDPRPVRLGAGMPDGYLVAGVAGANIYATTAGVFDRCLYAPDAERDYVCFDVPRAVDWVPVRTRQPHRTDCQRNHGSHRPGCGASARPNSRGKPRPGRDDGGADVGGRAVFRRRTAAREHADGGAGVRRRRSCARGFPRRARSHAASRRLRCPGAGDQAVLRHSGPEAMVMTFMVCGPRASTTRRVNGATYRQLSRTSASRGW